MRVKYLAQEDNKRHSSSGSSHIEPQNQLIFNLPFWPPLPYSPILLVVVRLPSLQAASFFDLLQQLLGDLAYEPHSGNIKNTLGN